MGNPLTGASLEVVILVLAGLVAINLVLVSALVTTIRQDRVRRARRANRGPSGGSRSGSV